MSQVGGGFYFKIIVLVGVGMGVMRLVVTACERVGDGVGEVARRVLQCSFDLYGLERG